MYSFMLKVRHWEDQLLARGPPTVGVPGKMKNDHFWFEYHGVLCMLRKIFSQDNCGITSTYRHCSEYNSTTFISNVLFKS